MIPLMVVATSNQRRNGLQRVSVRIGRPSRPGVLATGAAFTLQPGQSFGVPVTITQTGGQPVYWRLSATASTQGQYATMAGSGGGATTITGSGSATVDLYSPALNTPGSYTLQAVLYGYADAAMTQEYPGGPLTATQTGVVTVAQATSTTGTGSSTSPTATLTAGAGLAIASVSNLQASTGGNVSAVLGLANVGGHPTAAGTATVTVSVSDNYGESQSFAASVSVPALAVGGSASASAAVGPLGTFYGQTQVTFALPDGSSNGGLVQFGSPPSSGGTSSGSGGSSGSNSTLCSQLQAQLASLQAQSNAIGVQIDQIEATINAQYASDPNAALQAILSNSQIASLSAENAQLQQQIAAIQNQMNANGC